mgnify:CR=1 FL=1
MDGIEEYTGVTIISARSEEIRLMITEKLGRGLTIYKGHGGYPNAFVVMNSINDTKGGMIKKRALNH